MRESARDTPTPLLGPRKKRLQDTAVRLACASPSARQSGQVARPDRQAALQSSRDRRVIGPP
eukprot:7020206-Heterocapsa_arctica.AAC.1